MRTGQILIATVIAVAMLASTSSAQTTYEEVRDELAKVYTKTNEDGTKAYSKQFERWKWFWQARLTPDGHFPTAQHYLDEMRYVNALKKETDVQAIPRWEELGPVAPDLPSQSSVWSGIGRVNTMAISPLNKDHLFLGSAQGGLWQSTDNGSNWSQIDIPGYPVFGLSDIAIAPSKPNTMYIATGDADATFPGKLNSFPGFSYGVLKSTDNGVTWAPTSLITSPDQNTVITRLWVNPTDDRVIIAATYAGINKSTDGGENWNLVSPLIPFRDLISHPVNANILYAATFARLGGASMYRSTDGGETWVVMQSFSSGNRIRIAVTEANPQMVGIVVSRADNNGLEGVYRSLNEGQSFTNLNVPQNLLGWSRNGTDHSRGGQGFYDLAMEISPTNASMWFIGGINIWRSLNAGDSWVLSAQWTGSGAPWVHADQHSFQYHKTTGTMYACHDGGIARTTNNGVAWRDISKGLKIQQYYDLAVSNTETNLTLAGAQDNGTARTTNGANFFHVLGGDGMRPAIDAKNSSIVYASQPFGTFHNSTNGGSNWRVMSTSGQRGEPGGAWVAPIDVDPQRQGTVYIGYTNVYKSTNNGGTWAQISNFPPVEALRHLAVAPSNPNYIYAAFDRDVYYTSNGGSSWQQQSGISEYVQDIEVHPDNPKHIWVAFGGFSSGSKVFEIIDGDVTNITGTGLPNVPANALAFQKGVLNRLYLGTDVGVFYSDENDRSWSIYGANNPVSIVSGMKLVPSTGKLRISTYGRGVWQVDAVQCVAAVPSVSVDGDPVTCTGDTIVLTASDGYDVYSWSNGESGQQIKLFAFSQTGDYSVSVQDGDGCRSTSAPVSITIHRIPVRPNISLRGPDTLRSSAIGGVTLFQWFVDGEKIDGATDREHVATKTGSYTVVASNEEGCTTESREFEFVASSVDEDAQLAKITVSPNPVSDILNVAVPYAGQWSVRLIDIQGIHHKSIQFIGEESIAIDMAGLASGVYVVQAIQGDASWSSRIVKR